jgi:hypothetical protein
MFKASPLATIGSQTHFTSTQRTNGYYLLLTTQHSKGNPAQSASNPFEILKLLRKAMGLESPEIGNHCSISTFSLAPRTQYTRANELWRVPQLIRNTP